MSDTSQVAVTILHLEQLTPEELLLLTEFQSHPDSMYISSDGNTIITNPGGDMLVKMQRLVGRNFNELDEDELNAVVNWNYEQIAAELED